MKNNNIAYKTLLEIETMTTESNELYNYFNGFLKMLSNKKTLCSNNTCKCKTLARGKERFLV